MTWWDTLMLILSKFYFIFYPCTFSFSIHVIVVIIIFLWQFLSMFVIFICCVVFSYARISCFFGGGIVGCSKQLALNVISSRIWFVSVLFEGAKNAIAESVCVCVKNANVASKAYKWDECYICVWKCSFFGVSHLLDNSLRSNHRREYQWTASLLSVAVVILENKWFRFLLFKRANKLLGFIRSDHFLVDGTLTIQWKKVCTLSVHRKIRPKSCALNFGPDCVEPINCVWWDD